ncbi:nucleotidyltransferase domain-containing protein [bacterium]|nr:nucleotidyltransferase domain-containing protein [bacterium]MBU1652845.1 nucleotidyltransferase domain-containing protein [bacterium]MBU1882054.1 nucleotidyltransferase domain-containing protein [bacterium]
MSPKPKKSDRQLASRCAAEIRKLYPDAEVILYGSRARGDAEPESDLDLLVLTREKLEWPEEDKIIEALLPIELDTGVVIVPVIQPYDLWYSKKYQVMPIAKGVNCDGVTV